MTPELILLAIKLGIGAVNSFKANHDAGNGLSDGELLDATLAGLDKADAIMLQTLANAGLDPNTITLEQIKEWLADEKPATNAKHILEL